MAFPLVWLGAAALSLYAGNKINEQHLKNTKVVGGFPGESNFNIQPSNGAIVCCGIYGAFDHTGIYVDGKIIELNGNGLVRAVSPERFIENRSGELISIACDSEYNALTVSSAVDYCLEHLFSYRDYDVFSNNCHRFVAEAVVGRSIEITSFSQLNELLSTYFNKTIYWHRSKY